MPKEEWGTKRVCPQTGKRFYDLNKTPIISPYTGEEVVVEEGAKTRNLVADKADAETTAKDLVDGDEAVIEDDADDLDVELDDDILEDDDDDDTVPLEEIADVSTNDDD
ncbi:MULTISPECIES: TIGR02300 family protein [Halocynthiibacter]|uniref:TIGR02300 family protein n=1 Tax=Halocynthiibacter halioticoli TaxID=2986804 RepID=A0AAE3IX30_9RHOB|nr:MULTISPECIES: TIGR02300 family protein [Halocynthiibacter]MCV6823584.1 TIGR02300 family protein [Halocynthiibacter halioticoli]MCW4056585.1 TIGR02300 family protein [Halocynthiibacter sp. SDUM655004]MDE0590398.1 TIGR02300 family protein [Halocynthiibacter sp. C4]